MEWIDKHDRLPEKYARVLTLLFTNDGSQKTIVNSIQQRNYERADGSAVTLEIWAENNLSVTHWLEGVPGFPMPPIDENNNKKESIERTPQ